MMPAIAVNYMTASGLAWVLSNHGKHLITNEPPSWLWLAVLIGVIFVLMFWLMGKTTQEAGITTTSVASRMSVVIPMIFSILYYGETTSSLKIMGLLLAPLSVTLAVYKPNSVHKNSRQMWLPILVFLGVGITDSLVKYTQQDHLDSSQVISFSGYLFFVSMVSALILLVITSRRPWLKRNELIGGVFLGLSNLGSFYFFIQALNHSGLDSSVVFGINSTGIVLLSSVAGRSIFKESISTINIMGLLLAIGALVILFYV